MDKVENLRLLSKDKLERKTEEIEITLDPLAFADKVKVLNRVLDNMFNRLDREALEYKQKAMKADSQKEIIKELKDGKI